MHARPKTSALAATVPTTPPTSSIRARASSGGWRLALMDPTNMRFYYVCIARLSESYFRAAGRRRAIISEHVLRPNSCMIRQEHSVFPWREPVLSANSAQLADGRLDSYMLTTYAQTRRCRQTLPLQSPTFTATDAFRGTCSPCIHARCTCILQSPTDMGGTWRCTRIG